MRDVGVGQLVDELEQRGDRLPFEIGAFVALEACEGLLQESVRLEPDDVRVTLEGAVLVAGSAEAAEPSEAARSLVTVLARLLVAAGPGVPPYLLELVQDGTARGSERDLRALHDAIEASLIPVNRGASRRVLARLVRESERPPAPLAPAVPDIDPEALDAELDELLRDPASRSLEPRQSESSTPPGETTGERDLDDPVTERIRVPRGIREEEAQAGGRADAAASMQAAAGAELCGTAAAAHQKPPVTADPEPITATIRKWAGEEEPEADSDEATESVAEPAEPGKPLGLVTDPVVAPVEAIESVAEPEPAMAPRSEGEAPFQAETSRFSETPTESVFSHGSVSRAEPIPAPDPVVRESQPQAQQRGSAPEPPSRRRGGRGAWILAAALGLAAFGLIAAGALRGIVAPAPTTPARGGTVDLVVAPEDAQVFLYIGRGPSVADDLVVAAPHEFVVFQEGLRPTRVAVPEGAKWSTGDTNPLYELAVQPQPARTPLEAADFGPPLTEPSDITEGETGTVRVVTNPPGAKVYRYLGRGPDVSLEVDSIHEGQELLLVHPAHLTRRAVVGPSDWESTESDPRASLRVELPQSPMLSVPQSLEN